MSDTNFKLNDITLETKVYSVKDLRYTGNGKAVCSARILFSAKLDDEWTDGVWWDLTAWEDAAETLAECQQKDEVIVRGGRVKAKAYRNRAGEVVVGMELVANQLERVGSVAPPAGAKPAAPAHDYADVPF